MITDELKEALGRVAWGDVESALPVLEREAGAGNAAAQFTLGSLYANGEGVGLDHARAAELMRGAAEQGVPQAQTVLAFLYGHGYGVAQDDAEARRWYRAAAEGGDPEAQFMTATLYHFGRFGAGQDMAEAVRWYERAAQQDHARAQFALGKLLAEGKRVEADTETAFQWLTLAIMNGNDAAKKELAMLTGQLKAAEVEQYKQRMMERLGGADG